jgi:sulfotransferase
MEIFYNSSMPRAGSTIIQNILGQNPDFYVTPTSGLLELIFAARGNYTNSPEFKAQDQNLMKDAFLNFCRGGMKGYFESLTDKKYIVDKSRGWGIHYELLNMINPNPKIICVVRDLRDILSSMEKIYRKNQHIYNNVINHGEMKGTTTSKRVDIWLNTQPVGLAIERISEIFRLGIYQKIHFIKYEDLLNEPHKILDKVYEYLEIPKFTHDFNFIEQITMEDDSVYGIYGDHKIQTKLVELKQEHLEILGKTTCDKIKQNYKWYFNNFGYF